VGSVNAAASQLSLPGRRCAKPSPATAWDARPHPEAVRQRVIAAARRRSGQPATPTLDPVFVGLNPGALPARERPAAELYAWVRREEEYAILGASVVVELHSEGHARRPTTRAWAIIRRAERAHRNPSDRQDRSERRQADRITRSDRTSRSHQPQVTFDRKDGRYQFNRRAGMRSSGLEVHAHLATPSLRNHLMSYSLHGRLPAV
jgi:hypothetical protein